MKPRTARRARELWLCSPLLIFSSSLSSTGDHLPLPEGAHLSRAPIPSNQDILEGPEHRQWSRSWSSTRTIFKEGKTRMVGQPRPPPATIQVRRESRLAGEAGSSTSGCKCSAYKGGRGASANQPGESWTGGRLSHCAARWFSARPLGELNEDEGCVEERKEREVLRHPISNCKSKFDKKQFV